MPIYGEMVQTKMVRANNYDVASNMPPDNPTKRVDFMDIEELEDKCKDKPCSICRCYKSDNFPICDGSHASHIMETGDNAGPLVITHLPPEKRKTDFATEVSQEEKDREVDGPRANNYGVVSNMPPDNPIKVCFEGSKNKTNILTSSFAEAGSVGL